MNKTTTLLFLCCAPAVALAGANPLVNGVPASPAPGIKKQENVLGQDGRALPPCDASGRDKKGGTECQVIEPVVLPRDGVTDEILEKYRLRK